MNSWAITVKSSVPSRNGAAWPRCKVALTGLPPAAARSALIALPSAWVTDRTAIVIGVVIAGSSPSAGGATENTLLARIRPTAPAFWALSALVLNVHVPRSASTIWPVAGAVSGAQASTGPASTTLAVTSNKVGPNPAWPTGGVRLETVSLLSGLP